jgi:hypothetical protein
MAMYSSPMRPTRRSPPSTYGALGKRRSSLGLVAQIDGFQVATIAAVLCCLRIPAASGLPLAAQVG